MKKRAVIAVSVVLAVILVSGGLLSGCSKKKGDNVVKVVFVEGDKPKCFREENGKITGYDVEVFEELGRLWGNVKLEFDMADQSAMLLGVETGKYQIGSDGLFKNPSREEKFLFPRENLGYSPLTLLVKGDSTINSLEDMKGKTFTPLPANWGNYYILKKYIEAHPEGNYTFDTIDSVALSDLAIWVAEGRYDAYFGPTEWVPSVKEQLGLAIKISDTAYYEPTYPIFNKSGSDLADRYNTGIKTLKENGTLSRLSVKWFESDFFAEQAAFAAKNK